VPHPLTIPQYVYDRIKAKRGRLNVFDRFDPTKTALVVVDMQNFFVAEVETAKSIVPNINRLAQVVRERGGIVAWVVMTVAHTLDGPSLWPIYHDYFFTEAKMRAHKDGLTEGAEGHRLYPALDVHKEDLIAHKSRFSAFIQGASDLDARLRKQGIENLLVAGTATNMCCETTARDAMMIGYRAVIVHDASAARFDEDHLAGLTSFWQSFGDVRGTDDVIENLLKADKAGRAAE
jgi:ureidoacrylate peracid hydrolase